MVNNNSKKCITLNGTKYRSTVRLLRYGKYLIVALIFRQWPIFFSNTGDDFNCVSKEYLLKINIGTHKIRATKLTVAIARCLIYTGKNTQPKQISYSNRNIKIKK